LSITLPLLGNFK